MTRGTDELRRSEDSLNGCAADDHCVHRVAQASRTWRCHVEGTTRRGKASIGAHTGVKPGRHVLGREHSSTSVYLFVTFLSALARMVMPRYL